MKKFIIGGILFLTILLGGAFGYVWIEGCTFMDGLFMTMITITSVGYGEVVPLSPGGRIFTMGLILVGVSYVIYIFGKVTETVVEGGLRKAFGRINMDKKLAKLSDHYIVCGFGRIGKVICKSLQDNHRPFVVIDNNGPEVRSIAELGYLAMEGEAADDEVLLKAGICRARGLIAVVSSDADNVYIILSARGLNPELFIMARSSGTPGADTKLLRAGANKVISPYFLGARQMANMVIRPTVIDFLDLTVHAGEWGLRMEEIVVPEGASFVNTTLQDSEIRKKYDLIVVAIKREGEDMLFNPSHLTVIRPGDIMIVLGEYAKIKSLEKEL